MFLQSAVDIFSVDGSKAISRYIHGNRNIAAFYDVPGSTEWKNCSYSDLVEEAFEYMLL